LKHQALHKQNVVHHEKAAVARAQRLFRGQCYGQFKPFETNQTNSNSSIKIYAMSIYTKLETLGITLPPVAIPAAAYVPFVKTGNLVFLSGHIAKKDGKAWVGQLGKNMTTEEGKAAARSIAIDLLGTLHAAVGDLNQVKRIVKVMSLVNSTCDFTEQHLVTNGCSELLGEVFGPIVGAHARSAFGVAQIPMGACVEIELIAEV
jgi:enamine deaminase RidA (YjgF/YER057c/UK114 family)